MRGMAVRTRPTIDASHLSLSPLLAEAAQQDPGSDLSPREKEIARLVANGYPNKTVAAILDLSPWTVATYLRRIYAKLGVRCRAAMVARLFARDLEI